VRAGLNPGAVLDHDPTRAYEEYARFMVARTVGGGALVGAVAQEEGQPAGSPQDPAIPLDVCTEIYLD
jgi:hypothetical protein